jgi:uncharacterized protein (TIGR00290 family)
MASPSSSPSSPPAFFPAGARAAISFSAGKDSCLALHRARAQGLVVTHALTMFEETGKLSRSHGLPADLIAAQTRALGLETLTASASWADYEAQFVAELRTLKAQGITHMVFGDIDLLPHREWEEKVCAAAGLQPVLPLWLEPRAALAQEVVTLGFKPIVVCVNTRMLDAAFAGRDYDAAFLRDLPPSVDACGENGEFHTFVADGPGFSAPVPCVRGAVEEYVAPANYGGDRFVFQRLAPG